MRFPVARERVRVQDRTGTFLVLAVDRASGMAELIPTTGGPVETRVPLSSILPLTGEAPQFEREKPTSE